MIITLGNRKGGCGKSTSASFLACALSHEGRTLLVDADSQGSILAWSEAAEDFPAVVVAWPVRDLAKRIQQVAGDYAHVVIDTGRAPGTDDPILRQALMVSDQLVIPLSPSMMDARELVRVLEVVEELNVPARVLLTKVRAGTASARDVRAWLDDSEIPTFTAQIGLRETYATAWGSTPAKLGEYAYVAEELLGVRV